MVLMIGCGVWKVCWVVMCVCCVLGLVVFYERLCFGLVIRVCVRLIVVVFCRCGWDLAL